MILLVIHLSAQTDHVRLFLSPGEPALVTLKMPILFVMRSRHKTSVALLGERITPVNSWGMAPAFNPACTALRKLCSVISGCFLDRCESTTPKLIREPQIGQLNLTLGVSAVRGMNFWIGVEARILRESKLIWQWRICSMRGISI